MSITWFDGVQITVEIALSSATSTYGLWNSAVWNTGLWGPGMEWTDVSAYVRSIRTDRAFSGQPQAWNAGTAEVVLANNDGRFSPDNLSGPYVIAGVTGIRPNRPLRVKATYAGVTGYLYTGYITDWSDTWVDAHADAYVTVPCVDDWALFGDIDGFETTPVGAGETSGARIHRILDSFGSTIERNVAVGSTTVQATDLSANVQTELKLVADSEGGSVWIDANGSLVFESQYALLDQPRSNTLQAVFSDGSDANLPCSDVTPGTGSDGLKNVVAFTRVGGSAQVVADEISRALYQTKRYTRSDFVCETDAQALSLAAFYLEQHKAPTKRFTRIQTLPRNKPAALFPQVLARRIHDLIRVIARPRGSPTVTRDCHISGIHHVIDRSQWTTQFDLTDATVYQAYSSGGGFGRWDIASWGSNNWFF